MSAKPAESLRRDLDEATYECVDLKRVPAPDRAAIKKDQRVRAVIAAFDRLSLFVPTHIAQLLCDFARYYNRGMRIAAGGNHSVAVKQDGSLVSWGRHIWGQVRDTPTTHDFVAVSLSSSHSLALKEDGLISVDKCRVRQPRTVSSRWLQAGGIAWR